jgi:hypothetical protein
MGWSRPSGLRFVSSTLAALAAEVLLTDPDHLSGRSGTSAAEAWIFFRFCAGLKACSTHLFGLVLQSG